MGRPLPDGIEERVWELWTKGFSARVIARELGVSPPFVNGCVGRSGGVRPPARRRSASCLSTAEREEISRGLARGELQGDRASDRPPPHHGFARGAAKRRPRALSRAAGRSRELGPGAAPEALKLSLNSGLRAIVQEKLERKWSPQQISQWLRRTYPDDLGMWVSHETIYLSLFVQSRGALRRELCAHLRRGHRVRRPRKQRSKHKGRGQIAGRVMISERPAEAQDRAVPGHWEGDLLLGRKPSGIATLVERQTRYVQLIALPSGQSAEAVRDALAQSIGSLPEQLRRSLT